MLKQHGSKLLGRIDVEGLPGILIDLLLQLRDLTAKLAAVELKRLGLDFHSVLLHRIQRKYQRHLYLGEQSVHLTLFKLLPQHGRTCICRICFVAYLYGFRRLVIYDQLKLFSCHILISIIILQRIQQIRRNRRIKTILRILYRKIS